MKARDDRGRKTTYSTTLYGKPHGKLLGKWVGRLGRKARHRTDSGQHLAGLVGASPRKGRGCAANGVLSDPLRLERDQAGVDTDRSRHEASGRVTARGVLNPDGSVTWAPVNELVSQGRSSKSSGRTVVRNGVRVDETRAQMLADVYATLNGRPGVNQRARTRYAGAGDWV